MQKTSVKPRHVPLPLWVADHNRFPQSGNGEDLVWSLASMIQQEVKGAQVFYEPVLFRRMEGRGMQPDLLMILAFFRMQLLIEVTNSKSVWGCGKLKRMERVELDHAVPILFINRQMLLRLRQSDGLDILYCWIYYVMFKDPSLYGQICTPNELFRAVGEEVTHISEARRKKQQRRMLARAAMVVAG